MAETFHLASYATPGYTEERQAEYYANGSLKEVRITVRWTDGTEHELKLQFAGPPYFTFISSGALIYPDQSSTTVEVPPGGGFRLWHHWRWDGTESGHSETGTDTWTFHHDGSGRLEKEVRFSDGEISGEQTSQHNFTSDGSLQGSLHLYREETNGNGERIQITTTITLEGLQTVHTVVTSENGIQISDTVEITHVAPLSDSGGKRKGGRATPTPTKTVDPDVSPRLGPQPDVIRTTKPSPPGAGTSAVTGLPRSVGGGGGLGGDGLGPGSTLPLCEHWTDYYYLGSESEKATYLGSQFRGVGPC